MSLNEYITISDIKHRHTKQFPDSTKQEFVDEANDWLEDIGLQLGVQPADIQYPVGIIVRRYLANYVYMRIGESFMGSNNNDTPETDKYRVMWETYREVADTLLRQITPQLLRGESEANREARSVSSGRLYRTA